MESVIIAPGKLFDQKETSFCLKESKRKFRLVTARMYRASRFAESLLFVDESNQTVTEVLTNQIT